VMMVITFDQNHLEISWICRQLSHFGSNLFNR
jgi:hypothetical protein